MISDGLPYTLALAAVALSAGYAAYRLSDPTLAAGAGVVGAYALHLVSLRRARSRCREARILDRLAAELEGTVGSETIVVRRFTMATVALIEGVMDVKDVLQTQTATKRRSDVGFGACALEKGHLSAEQVKALTSARREARFLTDQVRRARRRLLEFRREEGAGA